MSIRLLFDKPTTSLKHLCEGCVHGAHVAGPGWERYICTNMRNGEIRKIVTECSMYRASERDADVPLVGKMREEAWSVVRVNGTLHVLSPEEYIEWDQATDHDRPFVLRRDRTA